MGDRPQIAKDVFNPDLHRLELLGLLRRNRPPPLNLAQALPPLFSSTGERTGNDHLRLVARPAESRIDEAIYLHFVRQQ